MTDALQKVDTPLSERYITTCTNCDYERQVFGTKDEARASAVLMGWEFRDVTLGTPALLRLRKEIALCPHCRLLVKESP